MKILPFALGFAAVFVVGRIVRLWTAEGAGAGAGALPAGMVWSELDGAYVRRNAHGVVTERYA